MSIRFKVILPYLFLTLLVAVTGAYVVTRLVTSSIEERLNNQLLEAGRVVSDRVAEQERQHIASARMIAFTRGLGEALSAGDLALVTTLAKPVMSGQDIEDLLLIDASGNESVHFIKQQDGMVMDVSRPAPSTLSIVYDLLAENDPDSLPKRIITQDAIDNRYYYFTAIPVEANGQMVGAVVVGTSLNVMLPQLKNTSLADVIFYDQSGHSIASTLGVLAQDGLSQRTISITKDFYQTVISEQTTVNGESIDVGGRKFSLAYGPLKVSNDTLAVFAVVLPLDFAVESGSNNRNNYILLYSVAMIGVILIGYFVSRIIINPLSKLVSASRAIASGDLTKRTEIKSRDEIGVLAQTFNEMTDHLQQRTLELEKTNKILEQMDRAKIRFIQIAAHELRTPLTLAQGYAQMVEIKARNQEDLARYSRGILDGTSRMVEIIDSMLDVSRIDMNRLDILPVEVRLDELVEKVKTSYTEALAERQLTLLVDGLQQLPIIQGDRDLLYKLFNHIIVNAIKYTPDGGTITICGQQVEEDEIEITVQDTGIGVAPENQKLVFEKFYQTGEVLLHSSGKTKFRGGGPGLGLAISRGIVNSHRGRIWLQSPGFDENTFPGTTVHIRLPIHQNGNENH